MPPRTTSSAVRFRGLIMGCGTCRWSQNGIRRSVVQMDFWKAMCVLFGAAVSVCCASASGGRPQKAEADSDVSCNRVHVSDGTGRMRSNLTVRVEGYTSRARYDDFADGTSAVADAVGLRVIAPPAQAGKLLRVFLAPAPPDSVWRDEGGTYEISIDEADLNAYLNAYETGAFELAEGSIYSARCVAKQDP